MRRAGSCKSCRCSTQEVGLSTTTSSVLKLITGSRAHPYEVPAYEVYKLEDM